MCVMLALVESDNVMGVSVELGTKIVDVQDAVRMHEGTCLGLAVDKSAGQGPPTTEEIEGELYLPPLPPGDQDIPPIPECRNAKPSAVAEQPITFSSIRETIFTPACTFSSCHGASAVAGLELANGDVHDTVMTHSLVSDAGMPLVTPGDPERSWLYQFVAKCEPARSNGSVANHMPLNAPILLDDALVAKLRAWSFAGAPDD